MAKRSAVKKKPAVKKEVSIQSTATPKVADLVVKIEMTEKEKGNADERKGRVYEYTVPQAVIEHGDVILAEAEQVQYDTNGNKKSNPSILKFNRIAWGKFRQRCLLQGFNHVRVLYAPPGIDTKVFDLKDIGDLQNKKNKKV